MRKKLDTQQYYDKYEKSRHSLGMFRMPARFDKYLSKYNINNGIIQEYYILHKMSILYL